MCFKILSVFVIFFAASFSSRAQTLSPATLSGFASHSQAGNADLTSVMGQPVATKLTAGSVILTQGCEQPEIQINTDTITGNNFIPGDTLVIPYTAFGYVDPSNIFTAQLSDSTGSFAVPLTIGSNTGTASDTISAAIPSTVPSGQNYRIRVVGSSPLFFGRPSQGFAFSNVLSITTILPDNFIIYPNPTSDYINISPLKNMDGKITIDDVNGNQIFEGPFKGEETQVYNLSRFPSGIYIIAYQDADGVAIKKVVKQ